ncbi:apolipoprotein C-II [Pseudophryne corroboree]|uniref:apolipoprotein C-II n=1 Tax=Pseudophryne corroboree TaxID=495146 RepID=UPI0030815FF3
MNPSKVLAISLVLLLISTGIESYRIQKRESPTFISQAQDLLTSAWESFSSKTEELVQKARVPKLEDAAKEYYETITNSVKTYTNVLNDQLYHWWHGN